MLLQQIQDNQTEKNKSGVYYLPFHNSSNDLNIRLRRRRIALNRKSQREYIAGIVISLLMLVMAGYVMARLTARAIDIHIQNQDTMLCNSAKVSGNREYGAKCQCYYNGEDISCIQGGGEN